MHPGTSYPRVPGEDESGRLRRRVAYGLKVWLLLMVMLVLLLAVLYRSGVVTTTETVADRQRAALHEAQLSMSSYLDWAQRDVVYLGRLGRFLGEVGSNASDWLAFERAFVDLLGTRGDVYAQARYIDETGMERVRVDSLDGTLIVKSPDELQNKADRYYVTQALNAQPGTVNLSRFDLNEEHGRIERPYNPMVRFSTRLRDASGLERGVLVLNVRAQPLIDRMKAMVLPEQTQLWMLNGAGGWLMSSQSEDEWRFMDPVAENTRLGDRRPELWEVIRSSTASEPEIHSVKGGLLTSLTFDPQTLLKIEGINLVAESDMKWHLAAWLPEESLSAHLTPLRQRTAVAFGALSILFLTIAVYSSQLWIKRRVAQEAQARGEAQYRELLESAPDAIVVVNAQGTIEYANVRAFSLFGYTQEELLGNRVDMLIPPHFREVHAHHMSSFATALPGKHEMAKGREVFAQHRNGHQFPVVIALNKIEGTSSSVNQHVIATIHDVTQVWKLQAAMADANLQLQTSNKDLESFSYSIAHDLRSPLRTLKGFSELLLDGYGDRLDAEANGYLKLINNAAQHMGNILTGMMELSQVTRSKLEIVDLDLSNLAAEIVELLRGERSDRNVEVLIEPGMTARGDKSLVTIALLNLLANAWKFTAKVPEPKVQVGSRSRDGQLEFFVRDNGAGFDMQHASKLFDAFQRLHSAEEFPGTGIGLATVSRVIRKHGGQIRGEGMEGKGATFYFSLGGSV